jgi:hypothetical protein
VKREISVETCAPVRYATIYNSMLRNNKLTTGMHDNIISNIIIHFPESIYTSLNLATNDIPFFNIFLGHAII